MNIQKTGI